MKTVFLKIATISWMCCILSVVSSAYAYGDTVARVTDLQGPATAILNGQERGLRILARIKDGTIIELEKGTMVTLHFSAKRRDMRFVGPATVKVNGQSANASNGVASTKDHKDIGISLDLSGSGLGGIIARGVTVQKPVIKLQHPVKSKVIANRPLTFSWSSSSATAVYTVSIRDRGGKVIMNTRTTDTQLRMPSDIQLEAGARYEWTLSTNLGGGEATQSSADFSVADSAEAAKFYAMSSIDKATVSDLVLYALQLDAMKLNTESETIWQRLEIIRPGISASR